MNFLFYADFLQFLQLTNRWVYALGSLARLFICEQSIDIIWEYFTTFIAEVFSFDKIALP